MFSLFFTRLFGLRKITTVTSGKESKGFCFLCTGLGGVLGFRLADSRITRITQRVKCSFPNPQREKNLFHSISMSTAAADILCHGNFIADGMAITKMMQE